MKTKLFLIALLASLTLHTSSHASFGDVAAGFVGAFIGTSIANGIQQDRVNRAVKIDTENRLYIYEMARDYNPMYHNEYVNCILASCLPYHQKMAAINVLNEKYKVWL